MVLSSLDETTEELFDKPFAVNVKGPFFLARKPSHIPPGSHIVLFSTAASTVLPGYLPYVSSKGAIEQMTRVLCKDVGRKGICVNSVAPGPTATDMFLRNQTEQLLNSVRSASPNGRLGDPEDIADSIAFLCSNDSRWVSGQTLRVNGGMA